jgi:hypothetical protein
MSDPRNAAHDKKVTQEKKHQGSSATAIADRRDTVPGTTAEPSESSTAQAPSPALEGSLVVLSKLKELEFHSRAHLERLAELALTVDDELKQTQIAGPLGEVYAAQSEFQTKLTALIETYKAECDRMQSESGR